MSTQDDLSGLKSPDFVDALVKLEELMTQNGRTFLIGAGCSKCAGLPLTVDLTKQVLDSGAVDATAKAILSTIESDFAGAASPNIEDYLSELVDQLAIVDRWTVRRATRRAISLGGKDYTATQLRESVEQIKRAIADVIDKNVDINTHWKFIRAVHRPVRPGTFSGNQCVDYLVLNYDTLIEDALALEKVPFADGMRGGASGWWCPETFDANGLLARVLKLHGSINWTELDEDPLPRRIPKTTTHSRGGSNIVIWPASTKYRETQRDPYAQLADRARKILRPAEGAQRVLVVCGYSFGDSHINIDLDRAIRESSGRLTLVVFSSEPSLDGQLKIWNQDMNIRDQLLVYGIRGFWHGAIAKSSKSDLPWWKFENITRLLAAER